jgi:hypothetical protein
MRTLAFFIYCIGEAALRVLQFIAAAVLALICALPPARAEKRVALVIGNDRYANLAAGEQLRNAANDARTIGAALKDIGFDVIADENLGRSALVDRFGDLLQRLSPVTRRSSSSPGTASRSTASTTFCRWTCRTSRPDRGRA